MINAFDWDDEGPATQPMAVAPPPARHGPPSCPRCHRLTVAAVIVRGKWTCPTCGVYVRADGREDTS